MLQVPTPGVLPEAIPPPRPLSSPSCSPYSRQHPNLTLQILQVFADGPLPAEAFVDILSFPKRVLYFLSVYEYPSVWFYHVSGTGQVVLGFLLRVTDPAGPPLVHLVPAPCPTGEGKQYWMKLKEASVGKQLSSHPLTLNDLHVLPAGGCLRGQPASED